MDDFSRRRLLAVGGSGTALTLAGCLSFGDDSENGDANAGENDDGNDTADPSGDANGDPETSANGDGNRSATDEQDAPSEGEFAVTLAADIDQESAQQIQQELQSRQQEIQKQVENGEIDQQEAQSQMQEARQTAQESRLELIRESVASIEDHLEATDGIALSESATDAGLLLVSGSADRILGLLELDETAGLLAESEFEQLQQTGP